MYWCVISLNPLTEVIQFSKNHHGSFLIVNASLRWLIVVLAHVLLLFDPHIFLCNVTWKLCCAIVEEWSKIFCWCAISLNPLTEVTLFSENCNDSFLIVIASLSSNYKSQMINSCVLHLCYFHLILIFYFAMLRGSCAVQMLKIGHNLGHSLVHRRTDGHALDRQYLLTLLSLFVWNGILCRVLCRSTDNC